MVQLLPDGQAVGMTLPPYARPAPVARAAAAWLPRGDVLPAADWGWRHRVVSGVLAVHVPVLTVLALLRGEGTTALTALLLLGGLLGASFLPVARRLRALAASLGLLT